MTTLVLLPGLDGTGELFAPFVEALTGHRCARHRVSAGSADELRGARSCRARQTTARRRLFPAGRIVFGTHRHFDRGDVAAGTSRPDSLLHVRVESAANVRAAGKGIRQAAGDARAAGARGALAVCRACNARIAPCACFRDGACVAQVLRARVAAVLAVDYRPLLRRIEVPMLYLRAKADRLIPAAAGRAILDLRAGCEIDRRSTRPHFLLQTEPEACARAVEKFMEHDVKPDPPLDVEQSLRVSKLTPGRPVGHRSRNPRRSPPAASERWLASWARRSTNCQRASRMCRTSTTRSACATWSRSASSSRREICTTCATARCGYLASSRTFRGRAPGARCPPAA